MVEYQQLTEGTFGLFHSNKSCIRGGEKIEVCGLGDDVDIKHSTDT